MAHYNLNKTILDLKGKPIKNSDKTDQTYQDLVLDILGGVADQEEVKNAELKRKIFKLSTIIASNNRVSLSPKQVAFIIERAEKISFPLALGRLEEFFDCAEDVKFGDEEEQSSENVAPESEE